MKSKKLWSISKIWDDSKDCVIFGGGFSVIRQLKLNPELAPTEANEYKAFGNNIKHYFEDKNVIGVNNAFMLGSWVDVAFWGDAAQYFRYKKQYDDFKGVKITCHPKYENTPVEGIHYIKRFREKRTGLTDKRKFIVWNFNSGASAINIAMHMGAKRILLLGFDMYTDPELNRTHWHSGYPDKRNTPTVSDKKRGERETIRVKKPKPVNPPYARHLKGFKDIAKDAIEYGLEIINLNPKSKIEVFSKAKALKYLSGGKDASI